MEETLREFAEKLLVFYLSVAWTAVSAVVFAKIYSYAHKKETPIAMAFLSTAVSFVVFVLYFFVMYLLLG